MKIDNVKYLVFNQLGDERGHLVAIEGNQDIPFDIKRIFYIYGSDKQVIRGLHANKKSEFILINVSGESKIKVYDGHKEKIYHLTEAHTGIYIPKLIWKEMYDFSDDSVLLVLSNEHYDDNEYIRNLREYREIMTQE